MSFFPSWNAVSVRERWDQLTTESAVAAVIDNAVRKAAATALKTKDAAAATLHKFTEGCSEAVTVFSLSLFAERVVEEEGQGNDGVRPEGETPEMKELKKEE